MMPLGGPSGCAIRSRRGAARTRRGAGPVTLSALLGRLASTVGKVLRRRGVAM